MKTQQQIVNFLEYMKIPIAGHIHEGCNLGNCAFLAVDFNTPEGLKILGDALEVYMWEGKRKKK